MIVYINFNNISVAPGKFNIKITVGDGTGTPVNYNNFNLISWGTFDFGDDSQQNEILIRASQTDISFRVGEETEVDWLTILFMLMEEDAKIEFTTNSTVFWTGFVDKTNVKNDQVKRTIELKCKDGFSNKAILDETTINSIIDSLGTPSYIDREDRAISLTKLIAKLSNQIYGINPTLHERTRLKMTLQHDSEVFDSGDTSDMGGLFHIASYAYNLLNSNLYGGDATKIIKSCLAVLNSYAITGIWNKLHILPLYNQGVESNVFDLDGNLIMESEVYRYFKIPALFPYYLIVKVDSGTTYNWAPEYANMPDEYQELFFPAICGDVQWLPFDPDDVDIDGTSKTLVYIYYPGDENNIYKIMANTCQYYVDGTWSTRVTSLFNHANDKLVEINRDKYGVKIKINGVKNPDGDYYSPEHEYTVPMFGHKIMRTRKIKLDLVKNITELTLLEY